MRVIDRLAVPGRAAELMDEGRDVHGVHQLRHVEHARVVDQAAPRLVPLARDHIDHIAAVGGAERAGPLAVDPGIGRQRRLPALLQVFQRTIAPVVVDGVGEGLAVTRRAMEVDHHHRIARRCIDLRIPAVGPALGPGRLGPAVDQIDGRILAALDEARGFEHPAVRRLVVPAGEADLLGTRQVDAGQQLGVVLRRLGGLAVAGDEDLRRGREALMGVGQNAADLVEIADRADVGQGLHRAGSGVDLEQAVLAFVGGGDIKRPTVRTPGQAAGTAIPAGQGAGVRAVRIGHHDHRLIAADVLARGGQPGQAPSVGRQGGRAVRPRVIRGQVDGGAAVQAQAIQVAVVGEGGAVALHPRRIDQGPPVARERQSAFAHADVRIQSGGQIARRALGEARAVQRLQEEMALAPVGPAVEHAQRHPVIDLLGRLGPLGQSVSGAVQGLAIRIDRHAQHQGLAVRREAEARHGDRKRRRLRRRQTLAVRAPHLVRSAARRQEIDRLPVRRPARARDAAVGDRQATRRRRAVDVGHPQAGLGLVAGPVRGGHGVDDAASVGRDARIADPFHRRQILQTETIGRRGLGRSRNRRFLRQRRRRRQAARQQQHLDGRRRHPV